MKRMALLVLILSLCFAGMASAATPEPLAERTVTVTVNVAEQVEFTVTSVINLDLDPAALTNQDKTGSWSLKANIPVVLTAESVGFTWTLLNNSIRYRANWGQMEFGPLVPGGLAVSTPMVPAGSYSGDFTVSFDASILAAGNWWTYAPGDYVDTITITVAKYQ